jgi:glutamine synthetase
MVLGFEAPVYPALVEREQVSGGARSSKRQEQRKVKANRVQGSRSVGQLVLRILRNSGSWVRRYQKKAEPGDPINEDMYKMSETARRGHGIRSLPGSLQESPEALKNDQDYMKPCFHGDPIDIYVALKRDEIAYAGSKERQFMLYYDV